MPKERRIRSASFERKSRASPFSFANLKHPSSSGSVSESASSANDIKEWEEVRCPVCMECPHNAVLLVCSSRDNGCRPFMCDTSYRHSNCLDQFRKAFAGSNAQQDDTDGSQKLTKFLCPLCRGQVSGWEVIEPARRYMNAKSRSCSLETCSFIGTYRELRKHARTDHPSTRPTDTDPDRERDWRRMEQQRDIGDLMSTLHAAIGGSGRATGIDGFTVEEDDIVTSSYALHPVALYLVVRLRLPASRNTEHSSRVQTRSSARRHRHRGVNLWGETLSEQEPTSRANPMSTDEHFLSNEQVGSSSGDNVPVEAPGSTETSQQARRSHRQLILLSDDDVDDDDMSSIFGTTPARDSS